MCTQVCCGSFTTCGQDYALHSSLQLENYHAELFFFYTESVPFLLAGTASYTLYSYVVMHALSVKRVQEA